MRGVSIEDRATNLEVRKVLDENKAERHIRGGMATKLKYEKEHKKYKI